MQSKQDIRDNTVIAPNFKRRLSGVTSTIIQLVPLQRRLGLAITTLGPGLPAGMPRMRWVHLPLLWRRPRDGKPRVWHARRNNEMLFGILLRDLARFPLKLVFTCEAQRDHKPFTKFMMRKMDEVITTNTRSAAFIEGDYKLIAHGTDTDRFVPPVDKAAAKHTIGRNPDRKIIGCTGRVRASKGTDVIVDAAIKLLPDFPDWDVLITGRTTSEHGSFKRGLVDRIEDAGLTGRIVFVDEVPDVLPWYQAFDLFIAPSRNEGYGLTPLEAMACGVPSVTSDAGAYRDMIVDGENGFCVKAGDSVALGNAIRAILCDPAKLRSLSSNARPSVESRFALHHEALELTSVYAALRGSANA